MIKSDTIIYEKSGTDACLALLDKGQLREFELFKENGAAEGNVYLGRITKKINLAEDKIYECPRKRVIGSQYD